MPNCQFLQAFFCNLRKFGLSLVMTAAFSAGHPLEKQKDVTDAEDCKYYRADVYDVTEGYIFAVGNPIRNSK